jgi:hypothetical protein
MGARNQVGIGLSYRPASLCNLATQFRTRFLELIPRPMAGLKFSALLISASDGKEREEVGKRQVDISAYFGGGGGG